MSDSDNQTFANLWIKPECDCSTIVPANPVRERAEFQCAQCRRVFPKSLIEEVDGVYRRKEIKVSSKRPRRR